jgi:hypothetical protein
LELIGYIASDIDARDAIALAFERIGTGLAGPETDLALG